MATKEQHEQLLKNIYLSNKLLWGGTTLTSLGKATGGLPGIVAKSENQPLAVIIGTGNRIFLSGGVYDSQDGEWRPVAMAWEELTKAWTSEGYKAHKEIVEGVVLDYFTEETGPLTLDGDPEMKQAFEMSSKIPLIAQLIALVGAFQVLQRNIDPAATANTRIFCELGSAVLKIMTAEQRHEIVMLLTRLPGQQLNPQQSKAPALRLGGAKLRPLTLAELSHPFNPKLPAWREHMIDVMVTDLAINEIVKNQLPYALPEVFMVEGTGEDFYANQSQHEKYRRAEGMVSIRQLLDEARRSTMKQAKDETVGSDSVELLDTHLVKALRYLDAKLVMTDVSMLKFSGYIGRPLKLYSSLIKAQAFGKDSPRNAFFRDARKYAPVLVDWLYTLYVLHSRTGIIHFDLHAGNVIIGHNALRKKQHVFYVHGAAISVDGDDDDPKAMGGFIDFSRANAFPSRRLRDLLLPEQREEFADTQYEQLARAIGAILEVFSDTHAQLAHKAKMAAMAAKSFPALLFRAATALDVAMLARTLLTAAGEGGNPSKEFTKLAAAIEVEALADFAELLTEQEELEGATFEKLPPGDWPALRALKKHFGYMNETPAEDAETLHYDAPFVLDPRNPAEFAKTVCMSWNAYDDVARPPPELYAAKGAESYAALHAKRMLAIQQMAAMHRKTTSAETTGSWII